MTLISDIPRCKDITKLERRCNGCLVAASGVVGGDPLLPPPDDAKDSDDVDIDDGELGACMMINYKQML